MKQPALGQKILELRKQKGLTQEELVDMCNINVRTIQRIEAGEVMPRSFTLKTILNALGEDLEVLKNRNFSDSFDLSNLKFSSNQIKLAWISGLIYFLSGFMEFAVDYARFYEQELIIPNAAYISMKLIVLLALILFMRGFILSANYFSNYLLKIASYYLISTSILFYGYDIATLYFDGFYLEYVLITQSIFFGLGGFIFGFALLRWETPLGIIPKISGGFEIAAGVMFILVFMAWLGYLFILPAIFLQIILLYKLEEFFKKGKLEIT